SPIMEIARIKPMTRADLTRIKGLSLKQIDQMGRSLIEKVMEGLSLPNEALPTYPKKTWERLRSRETRRVKALKSWRERLGGKWGVDPSVVCTNAQILAIALANPRKSGDMQSITDIRKWQIKLLGPDICSLLQETG
ncbi:MAG: HRDC domain-containing protein, partial [Desulfobacteraceae bacterium]|nr:HRDC domain-containing protein [Desulfobacteraceae bacterium]